MKTFPTARIAAAIPPAEAVRQKADEILARPEYQLNEQGSAAALNLFYRLLQLLLKPVIWFFNALEGLPDAIRWLIVIVLSMICIALVVHIVWTFVAAFRGPSKRRYTSVLEEGKQVTPEELEAAAETEQAQGDYIGAVRHLFRASLLRIERFEKKPIRRGITNRELLRRYGSTPLKEPLSRFAEVIDAKWYGREACELSDFEVCRAEHGRIREFIERRVNVAGA